MFYIILPLQSGMACDIGFHAFQIDAHDFKTLRQCFDIFESRRPLGVRAQGFEDGFIELGRQRCFQYDHRHPCHHVLAGDFDLGVDRGRVGVDQSFGVRFGAMAALSKGESSCSWATSVSIFWRSGKVAIWANFFRF